MRTARLASLCQPAIGQNITIGILGNSITYGAEVESRDAWPAQLEKRLRAHIGVAVLNGAVRASSADFAALCWEEIWARSSSLNTTLDLAVIDYTYTSSALQIEALIFKLRLLGIPVLANLYCPHAYWHRELRKLIDSPPADILEVANRSLLTPKIRRQIEDTKRALLRGARSLNDRHMPNAVLGTAGERAATGAAALLVLPSKRKPVHGGEKWTKDDVHLAWKLMRYRNRLNEAEQLRGALDVLAAGHCLDGLNRTREVLHKWGVPYSSNARQLRRRAERVLTRGGAFAAHPNAEGHAIIARGIEALFWKQCSTVAQSSRHVPADTKLTGFEDQVCTTGPRMRIHNCAGFHFVDPGGGRQSGLVSNLTGALCELQLTTRKLRSGFMSLAFERGWRNRGRVSITCEPPCWCLPTTFEVGTSKHYTFTQRTTPRWTVLGGSGTCSVKVEVKSSTQGRVMIQGVAFAAPLPNNRSVDTKSLYALLVNDVCCNRAEQEITLAEPLNVNVART